jgi:hypothetical protein
MIRCFYHKAETVSFLKDSTGFGLTTVALSELMLNIVLIGWCTLECWRTKGKFRKRCFNSSWEIWRGFIFISSSLPPHYQYLHWPFRRIWLLTEICYVSAEFIYVATRRECPDEATLLEVERALIRYNLSLRLLVKWCNKCWPSHRDAVGPTTQRCNTAGNATLEFLF